MEDKLVKSTVTSRVAKHIAALKDSRGIITPDSIVDAARPEKSPLHQYFTWDDGEAAERYRLMEAAQLIRVCVTYLPSKPKVPVRAFVSIRDDRVKGGGYRVLADVLEDADLTMKLLQDALFELHVFEEKYKRIQELEPVFAAVRVVRKKN